jgi:hypothetical protein
MARRVRSENQELIYSSIKTSVTGDKQFKELLEKLRKYKTASVTIGIHEDAGQYTDGSTSVAEVALWNEFGTRNIPERSFLRSAIDDNASKINAWREEAIENIMEKGWTVQKALEMVGLRIQILIQNKIKSNVPPPNAPSTAKAKLKEGQAPSTLIATGLMVRSVTYKVNLK